MNNVHQRAITGDRPGREKKHISVLDPRYAVTYVGFDQSEQAIIFDSQSKLSKTISIWRGDSAEFCPQVGHQLLLSTVPKVQYFTKFVKAGLLLGLGFFRSPSSHEFSSDVGKLVAKETYFPSRILVSKCEFSY